MNWYKSTKKIFAQLENLPIEEEYQTITDNSSLNSPQEYYHGSSGIFYSSKDMPEGHRGYFGTTSPNVARKFGPNLHKITIKTNDIFDPLKDESALDIFADKIKHLYKLKGKEGVKDAARSGRYSVFENWQAQNALEELGFKGNFQIEDGEKVVRLFNKEDFDIEPIIA